jgi:hypothetical protein
LELENVLIYQGSLCREKICHNLDSTRFEKNNISIPSEVKATLSKSHAITENLKEFSSSAKSEGLNGDCMIAVKQIKQELSVIDQTMNNIHGYYDIAYLFF